MTRLSRSDLTVAWQSASLLLDYPDAALLTRLPLLASASAGLPSPVGGPLRRTVAGLTGASLHELERDYVETFDETRRNSLFLTYFAHGDTRKRGMALLRFRQTYLGSGVSDSAVELPDHLCVVLEYAATVDLDAGRRLLLDHRAGLEVLRLSLAESQSRWAGAIEAVTACLPPLRGDEHEAIRRLAEAGPPEEEVGLTPYAVGGPTALPMPSFPASAGRGR